MQNELTTAPKTNPNYLRAVQVALGNVTGSDVAKNIKGAVNDYNSKGRGSTMARRILRNGHWQWLSKPAARGRYLSADRNDVEYGDAYEGEIIASYTLGGNKTADNFYIVTDGEERPLLTLNADKIKTGYRLSSKWFAEKIEVSDPYWK